MSDLQLHLFVTGQTARSTQAIANLQRICRHIDHPAVTIIDILKSPELAEKHKIIATPTLIKRLPLPIRRIIGDLSNPQEVSQMLGIDCRSNAGERADDM